MARAQGARSVLAAAFETTYGTAPAAGQFWQMPFASSTLGSEQPLLASELLGYARAAAWIAGVDRWSEAMWRDLEQQIGEAPAFAAGTDGSAALPTEDVAGVVRRSPRRSGHRVFRSSYMS